MSSKQFVYN
uniref:Uncharacterized protein n=1 Tax=Moniliophthora roreri TaxID=221103 RepID=A0A0W0FUS9_MONRR